MVKKLIGTLLLGVLAAALVPGAVWARCGTGADDGCCCPEGSGKKCSMPMTPNAPASQRIDAERCCGPQAIPPAAATATDGFHVALGERGTDAGDATRTLVPPSRARVSPHAHSGPSPPPVALFTLHAALLI